MTDCPHSPEEHKLHRRTWMSMTLSGLAAMVAGAPVVGFLLGPFFKKNPQHWRTLGSLHEFVLGKTVKVEFESNSSVPWSGVTAQAAAWVRRTGTKGIDRVFSELCSPGLSSSLLRRCSAFHVPMSWRSVLFRWKCGGGSATAWSVEASDSGQR